MRAWRPANPRVNLSHPLSHALAFACVAVQNDPRLIDLVGNGEYILPGSGLIGEGAVGPFGDAIDFNNDDVQVINTIPTVALAANPASIMMVANPILSGDVANDVYFSLSSSSGATGAPNVSPFFGFSKGGAADRLNAIRASSSGNSKTQSHEYGGDPGWGVYLATHVGGNNYCTFYVDGQSRSDTTATAGTLGSGSGNRMSVARRTNEVGGFGTILFSAGYLWTRELTQEEAIWLAVEPFAFLEENHFVKYFFLGLGAQGSVSSAPGGARRFSSIYRARG